MILKINKKRSKNLNESVNMIPMINIIFLLLIFFLLTGVIQKKDRANITIPESLYGVKKDQSAKGLNNINININGGIQWNDQIIELSELVEIRLDENSKILLNVDKNAKIKKLNEVFEILKNKGIKKVLMNVRHKNVES